MNQTNHRHTVASPKYISTSNIPLRRTVSRQSSNSSTTSTSSVRPRLPTDPAHRWKQKYDECEEKRKAILSEKEKALRSLNDLEKKHLNLQVKHEHLETELFEKNEEFTKLSTASKNLYKEYETLKNQYETETGAMARALKDATQWYKENKQLKRRTLHLDKDTVDEGVDDGEATNDADIENLNRTIKQLSTEVAELQTELDAARQTEFQTLEQNAKISEDLEQLKIENERLTSELNEFRKEHSQLLRVSEMMKKEMEELRNINENQRTEVIDLRKEAGVQKRERNILAHQSNLLLQGLGDENGTDSLMLLQEIECLKRTIEEERTKYEEELSILQERLEDQENNSHVEILEERLKLVESELQEALNRADVAEQKLKAPPAPPPPPPPPLMPLDQPPMVPLRRRRSRATVEDLAKTIGIQHDGTVEKKPVAPGVNEDIINAIKEGKFTLRKRRKENNNEPKEKDKEAPKAVSELLNILGSLRRAPKKRQSLLNGGDVPQ
ncbi:shootin-1 [Anthonomus grandis grandis]|uniref:shootin-1 n=1 Tax=Anthonomus grandis grandis TaxID=2921223 RepID=UPI002166A7CA|nr:shootin-1 [Anthonomus grandis grandis]XP_050304370.1 shootin-1 [Anthonomus grandis grandis]